MMEKIYLLYLQVCVKSYNKWGWSILSEIVVIATNNVVGGYPRETFFGVVSLVIRWSIDQSVISIIFSPFNFNMPPIPPSLSHITNMELQTKMASPG